MSTDDRCLVGSTAGRAVSYPGGVLGSQAGYEIEALLCNERQGSHASRARGYTETRSRTTSGAAGGLVRTSVRYCLMRDQSGAR